MRSSAVVREIDRQLTYSADDVFSRGNLVSVVRNRAPETDESNLNLYSSLCKKVSSFLALRLIIAEKSRMLINSCDDDEVSRFI